MDDVALTPPRWYCIRSRQKHERIAAVHLRQMDDVEVFCPQLRINRKTRTGAKWFTEALFPGYLFARFVLETRHKEIRYSPGVADILRFSDRYVTIEDEVIQRLRQYVDDNQLVTITPGIAVGTEVEIIDGVLRGLEAVVTQILTGRERLRILVSFLVRQIEAEIHPGDLLPPRRHPLSREGL